MRITGASVLVIIVTLLGGACFNAPHFPTTPEIEYNSIIFRKGKTATDSLILTLNFKDGDGDLGLDPTNDDSVNKFSNRHYFKVGGGYDYQFDLNGSFISYKLRRTVPAYDTLPPYSFPYTCTNWQKVYDYTNPNSPVILDTMYFQLNPNYYNIFVDFYILQNDGSFQKFDWLTEFPDDCLIGGYDGRFPVLSKDLSQATVQEGKIRYTMNSAGWLATFSIKTMYVTAYIQDRALHKSNVVQTPKFTLQSIRK